MTGEVPTCNKKREKVRQNLRLPFLLLWVKRKVALYHYVLRGQNGKGTS